MKASFSFKNKTVSENAVPTVSIDTAADYTIQADEPEYCVLSNLTTLGDEPELVTYQCRKVKTISTKIDNYNPPKNTTGIQYGVKVDELFRVTDDDETEIICDLPITATLTFSQPSHSLITANVMEQVLSRLLGALYKTDGTTRINELMRLCVKPK